MKRETPNGSSAHCFATQHQRRTAGAVPIDLEVIKTVAALVTGT